jgi:hypothetical protein
MGVLALLHRAKPGAMNRNMKLDAGRALPAEDRNHRGDVIGGRCPPRASTAIEAIPKTYQSAVRTLAAAHAGFGSVEIFQMPDPQQRVVRLIEVSDCFPEGDAMRLEQSFRKF